MFRSSVSHLPRHKQTQLLVVLFFGSILSYFVLSHWVFLSCEVAGESMAPTLADGERRLAHRWLYALREPRRGDVVALIAPGYVDYSVKRIIGLPGEEITFEAGHVFIDRSELQEPYLSRHVQTDGGPLSNGTCRVAPGCYFVLGDNRGISADSRYFGAVPRRRLVGPLL